MAKRSSRIGYAISYCQCNWYRSSGNENIEKFIQKAHKYVGIEELDPYALRELVKAIYVDAPVKVNDKRTQRIHIQYDGIGFIPLEELLKEETA